LVRHGTALKLSAFVNEMTSKRLELIKELVPATSRIALFANMSNPVCRAADQVRADHQS